MIRLVVATLLLAAIAVAVRLKARGTGPTRAIKVTARAAINRGAVIAVVEAEGRRLLIGAAANQVSVLAELGAAEASPGEDAVDAPTEPRPDVRSLSPTVVDRIRKATVRTADPQMRPTTVVAALREGTRRHR
jgi:flagellar biogenesis protein FliO